MRPSRRKLVPSAAIVGAIASLWMAGTVPAASNAVPKNTSAPRITGTTEVGQTLTINKGTWSGTSPISYQYQWRRCDDQGASCSAIEGADDQTYVLKRVDSGTTLRARVVARNAEGSDTRVTRPTEVVKAAAATPPPPAPTPAPAPAPTGCPPGSDAIRSDQISPPARLVIDRQTISPAVVTGGTQSLTVRFHVSACGGRPVEGMLVYVTAVPYNQFTVPPEQPTGSDGWAQLTMQRARSFPASPSQRLLVVFVRARKTGESLLGGVSTRRLVSFGVDLSR